MIYTSDFLRSQDGDFENYHYQLEDGHRYQLTVDELCWLQFVSGRYSIADHLLDNISAGGVYSVDTYGMSLALSEDGCDHKAVCLSDDTALQAIFFYSSFEIAIEREN
jgi:hypothetical protein